jgi:hypothetical protein
LLLLEFILIGEGISPNCFYAIICFLLSMKLVLEGGDFVIGEASFILGIDFIANGNLMTLSELS